MVDEAAQASEPSKKVSEQGSAAPAEDKETKGFQAFASTATRTQRKGINEQLLAQLLIQSNTRSDPMQKIEALTEAAYATKSKDKIDMNIIEACSVVCRSFINTEKDYRAPSRHPNMIRVSWAFEETRENWEKYIKPWQRLNLSYYPLLTSYVGKNYSSFPVTTDGVRPIDIEKWEEGRDFIQKEVSKWLKKLSADKQFYEETDALYKVSFTSLKGEFAQWAMKNLRAVQMTIAEEINPEIYRDVLELMKNSKPSKEQVDDEEA